MSSKTAIVITSDPFRPGEEALGRAFNALASARELDSSGDDVVVQFQGMGTRWPGVLSDPTHPLNGHFEGVRHTIKGASRGCSSLFGATESVRACGLALLTENQVPGTLGVAGLKSLIDAGYTPVVF
jgi:hypothetical protein